MDLTTVDKLLTTTRSVRKRLDLARPVERKIIEECLEIAIQAPTGSNLQGWHFVVVTNPLTKKEIRLAAEQEQREFYQQRAPDEWLEALAPLGTNEHKPFLEAAPCLIVVFLKKFTVDEKGAKHKNYYTVESVGIATGILITALHLSGLATLTYTPSPMKFLNKILGRPEHERPYLILVTGYPAKGATEPVIEK